MIREFEYRIRVVTAEEILSRLPETEAASAPDTLFCDAEGVCFFDEAPNPYLGSLEEILNESGGEGWSLVQVIPRQQDLICFWRRER